MKFPWKRRREERQAKREAEWAEIAALRKRNREHFHARNHAARVARGARMPDVPEPARPPRGPSGASDANRRPVIPPDVFALMVHPPEAVEKPTTRRFDGQGWTPTTEMHTFGDPAYTITTNDTQEEPVTVVRPATAGTASFAPTRKEVRIRLLSGGEMRFTFEKMRNDSGMIGFLGAEAMPELRDEIPDGLRPAEEIWVPIVNVISIAIAPYDEPEV